MSKSQDDKFIWSGNQVKFIPPGKNKPTTKEQPKENK